MKTQALEELESTEKRRRRQRAEELAQRKPSLAQPSLSYPEVLRLVHELEVHQIELELQKEELELAKIEIETGLEKYEDLYDFAPVGYFTFDETGMILSANLTGARMLGMERSRLVKRRFQLSILSASQPIFNAFLKNAFDGRGKCECEVTLVKEQGRQQVAHVEASAVPSSPGKVTQCRAVMMDITARKEAETSRQQMEERFRQAQKLESLGTMAGGIAHDFNNLLSVILGHAELVLADLPPALPARVSLQEIIKATQRAADLSRQMLAFSGGGHLTLAPLDLSELIADMRRMAESAISKKARLSCRFAKCPLVVRADSTQMRQVIMNLLINASEAIGDRDGQITVVTSSIDCDRAFLDRLAIEPALPEGRYVSLEISDTGCGMAPDTLARAFDPFFTTKFTGRGLGLAVVQGIVRDHRGALEVRSEVGEGTTFRILLPAAEAVVPPVKPRDGIQHSWRGSGLVLLVDDVAMVRSLGKKLLEKMGFTVLTAVDGCDAVEIFAKHAPEIVCVLLDMMMPRMDGREALRELRRLRPDVRVVICSGYDRERLDRLLPDPTGRLGFIQKPFQIAEFSEKLRAFLTAPADSSIHS
jgi:PAS domain S-box-containing protein